MLWKKINSIAKIECRAWNTQEYNVMPRCVMRKYVYVCVRDLSLSRSSIIHEGKTFFVHFPLIKSVGPVGHLTSTVYATCMHVWCSYVIDDLLLFAHNTHDEHVIFPMPMKNGMKRMNLGWWHEEKWSWHTTRPYPHIYASTTINGEPTVARPYRNIIYIKHIPDSAKWKYENEVRETNALKWSVAHLHIADPESDACLPGHDRPTSHAVHHGAAQA